MFDVTTVDFDCETWADERLAESPTRTTGRLTEA
jgi:hypothetical protein